MRTMRTPLVAIVALALSSTVVAAIAGVSDASAVFDAKGPAGFKLEGKSASVEVKDSPDSVTISVPLGTLDTGIGLRNRHMREKYLQVDQFPTVTLEVPWSAIHLPADGQSSEGSATGKLTLHGQTHDAPFSYSIKRSGSSYRVEGKLPLTLTDYGITIPSYMGITVKPDIATTVIFTAIRS